MESIMRVKKDFDNVKSCNELSLMLVELSEEVRTNVRTIKDTVKAMRRLADILDSNGLDEEVDLRYLMNRYDSRSENLEVSHLRGVKLYNRFLSEVYVSSRLLAGVVKKSGEYIFS
jgi:predicted xylose isomerase-like sugar epimerase